jgi:predicted Zn-dependent protease
VRRAEVWLFAAVLALAMFVGLKVAHRPVPPPSAVAEPAPTPTVAPARAAPPPQPHHDVAGATVRTSEPPPVRDAAAIRERIAQTPSTYMSDMLDDVKGQLVRWPDRREQGLRIWVQSLSAVRDWDQRYAQMARDAFDDWGRDPLPIRFDFVLDSATSDIRIVWIERFAPELGTRVGTTRRTNDQNGWLVSAQIDIAIHDSTGRAIPPDALTGIMRHEAGHALGLGHSRDPRTKMFPIEVTSTITPADRATLRLLYGLPPGLVK